jgi:hypothetical protein
VERGEGGVVAVAGQAGQAFVGEEAVGAGYQESGGRVMGDGGRVCGAGPRWGSGPALRLFRRRDLPVVRRSGRPRDARLRGRRGGRIPRRRPRSPCSRRLLPGSARGPRCGWPRSASWPTRAPSARRRSACRRRAPRRWRRSRRPRPHRSARGPTRSRPGPRRGGPRSP